MQIRQHEYFMSERSSSFTPFLCCCSYSPCQIHNDCASRALSKYTLKCPVGAAAAPQQNAALHHPLHRWRQSRGRGTSSPGCQMTKPGVRSAHTLAPAWFYCSSKTNLFLCWSLSEIKELVFKTWALSIIEVKLKLKSFLYYYWHCVEDTLMVSDSTDTEWRHVG